MSDNPNLTEAEQEALLWIHQGVPRLGPGFFEGEFEPRDLQALLDNGLAYHCERGLQLTPAGRAVVDGLEGER